MNVAVAVAIGIIITVLILSFGTMLVLTLMFMRTLSRQLAQAIEDAVLLRGEVAALLVEMKHLVPLINGLESTFTGLKRDMQTVAGATLRSANSVGELNSLLTGARQIPPAPAYARGTPPPPNPAYDVEAPPEDQTETVYRDDEEIAREQERQEARDQGYETDPDADFEVPIQGVGV